MIRKFELYDYLFFMILIANMYSLSSLFGSGLFYYSSSLIHISLFFLLVIHNLNFNKLFNLKFPKVDIISVEIIILLIVFAFSSYYVNSSVNYEIYPFLKLFTYPILFYSFFVFFSKRFYFNDDLFEKVLSAILYFGVIHAVYSLVLVNLGVSSDELYVGHTVGIFYNPNSASFLYTIVIPILFYKFNAKKIKFLTFIIFFLILVYCLLFTFSRAGYISFFIVVMLYSYTRSKTAFFVMLILSVTLFFTVFLGFAFTKTDTSFSRALLYYTSIKMIFSDVQHFLWGYGVENAMKVFINEKINYGSFESVVSTHNFVLQLAIQFGVLLPVIFLVFVINIYFLVLKMKKKFAEEKRIKISYCLIAIFALFIQNMVEDTLAHPEFFILPVFLFLLGYLYNGLRDIKQIKISG